jgi:ATP-dependent Lon protease
MNAEVTMEHKEGLLLPVLAVRNVVIYPGTTIPLNVGRTKSVAAVEAASAADNQILVLAQQKDTSDRDAKAGDLYRVGTICRVEKVRGSAETGYQVLVRGLDRVRVTEFTEKRKYIEARTESFPDEVLADKKTIDALMANLKNLADDVLKLIPGDTRQLSELITAIDDANILANLCAEYIDSPIPDKQEILEMPSLRERILKLLELMQSQKEGLKLQTEIREKLSRKLGKTQREALLREQMRAIREELGEDDTSGIAEDYREKIEKAQMPEDAHKIAVDEAKRLESMGSQSPETHVIRNYLDLLCSMPWSTSTHDNLDLDAARKTLDVEHYGLEKIKRRIIQHLAVMKLKQGEKGSILLLVGPPGVGKTSLGHSIANALGRKFMRVSLGGVRDDSEIRGHRRTYVGAMPGRIVQGLKRAGVNNPVMLLDEIDKLGRGYTGDPAGALLEVLDPEQNSNFLDHYLDTPFDLSKVFFIATANSLETIPAPLLDRMEIVDLAGYITDEKKHIAISHLIPKQLAEHGIKEGQLTFEEAALTKLIASYTREAGVRELERKISEVMRYMTEKIVEADDGATFSVTPDLLDDIFGPEKYVQEVAARLSSPGVVTGLAWTPLGGEILFIEARTMPGTGRLILTGSLGDVMKESAQIALSLSRSHLAVAGSGIEFDKTDIHVHVPSGAIPKDGPSAGVTMITTLASLFTGIEVDPKLAMTGEVTLRGAVLPVGGIKEKMLAAHRAGIERVILPKRNQKDLIDVPAEVKAAMKFTFVEDIDELLKEALGLDLTVTRRRAAGNALPGSPLGFS